MNKQYSILHWSMSWFKSNWINIFAVIYILIALAYLLKIDYRRTEPAAPVVVPVSRDADIDQALKRLDALEKHIENQAAILKTQESNHEQLIKVDRQLDKRLQFQTETLKRMCEYIWVITIEKKLVPRQCYPDFNWRREDAIGN